MIHHALVYTTKQVNAMKKPQLMRELEPLVVLYRAHLDAVRSQMGHDDAESSISIAERVRLPATSLEEALLAGIRPYSDHLSASDAALHSPFSSPMSSSSRAVPFGGRQSTGGVVRDYSNAPRRDETLYYPPSDEEDGGTDRPAFFSVGGAGARRSSRRNAQRVAMEVAAMDDEDDTMVVDWEKIKASRLR